ncbi:hypothetical protein [Paractinoplanes globisporus]|uniref:Uncharacterized protein n=1 Tax=Paractinoplanes globisporus TaxID=113565 RepID=A0ABW6WEZ0_9ACTN|nr:hypothetical protein [Actinoplanes globisporus]
MSRGRVLVKPGHIGVLYQTCSALYTGQATPRSLIMLPVPPCWLRGLPRS